MKKKLFCMMLAVSLMLPTMPVMASEVQELPADVVEVQEEAEELVELTELEETPAIVEEEQEVVEEPVIEEQELSIEDEILGAVTINGDYVFSGSDASGITSGTLDKDYVINGDLTIENSLYLNGHKLTVNGDVIHYFGRLCGDGGRMDVKGDFVIANDTWNNATSGLYVEDGIFNITGDFGLHGIDQNGDVKVGKGIFEMEDSDGQLYVGGDFAVNHKYFEISSIGSKDYSIDLNYGTICVGGNFDVTVDLSAGYSKPRTGIICKIVLDGNGPQKIDWADPVTISNLQINNPNVITIERENASFTLLQDATITGGTEGLSLRDVDLKGNNLTVQGDVVVSGNMDLNEGSCLNVTGDYVQTSGALQIKEGTADIKGSLYLQGRDARGKATVGTGSITMNGTGANLNIGKDWILQTTAKGIYEYGILTLKGNLNQLNNYVSIVGDYGHRVILSGDGSQKITFKNADNTFNILEIKKPLTQYTFSPAKCWKTLVGVSEWPFTDLAIKDGYWKYESVKYVYENNIMNGVGDGTRFQPDGTMTRAMFATVLYRLAGNPKVSYEPIFSDVPEGKWYSDAIVWAYRRGIVNGYPDGRFGHGDSITREQMAKMLKGYADIQKYSTSERGSLKSFADIGKVSGWAKEYMQWAVGSGMISGKENAGKKYLDPAGKATRAECATMLKRFIEKY